MSIQLQPRLPWATNALGELVVVMMSTLFLFFPATDLTNIKARLGVSLRMHRTKESGLSEIKSGITPVSSPLLVMAYFSHIIDGKMLVD